MKLAITATLEPTEDVAKLKMIGRLAGVEPTVLTDSDGRARVHFSGNFSEANARTLIQMIEE